MFWHLIKLSFKQQLAYRLALWAGLATNLFFGLLRAVFLIALYGQRGEVNGLTVQGAVTYVGLSQALIAFLSLFGSMDLADSIYSGAIGADLLRPMPFFLFSMGRELGKSIVNLVGRGVLFMMLFGLFFPLILPVGWASWVVLIISLVLAWLISFTWRYTVSLAAFWSPDARGFLRIAATLVQFFSGFIMPLALLPGWFSVIAQWTPFPAMVYTPVMVFLSGGVTAATWNALGVQVLWCIALVAAAHIVFRAGVRHLVVQGG